jgi:glycosyltransferase involved in cell wall biosynthesis
MLDFKGLIVSMHGKTDRSAYTHRLESLAGCLEARGCRCEFLHMQDAPPLHKSTSAPLFMPFWINKLRKYDFVHCGDAETGQALFFCRPFLRRPVILDVHGDVIAESALANQSRASGVAGRPDLRVTLQYLMARSCADHFLAVSKFQEDALIREGVPPGRISLVRNGVDLELFSAGSGVPPDQFTFAYAGGFDVWQAVDLLVDAFARLEAPRRRLHVVGFTPDQAGLRDRISRRLGAMAELTDRVDQQTLVRLLRSATVLVIPRREHQAIRNAFPTKFAEYAALGKPIIVNDVDETAVFIRRYGSGFVAEASVEGTAKAMSEAMGASPTLLQQMGRRARTMAQENFSWDIIGNAYTQAIESLVERFARKRGAARRP